MPPFSKGELDQHQLGQIEDDAAGRAVELGDLAVAGLGKEELPGH